jgi:hypothetical protein
MTAPVLQIKEPADVFNLFNGSRSFWSWRNEKIAKFRDFVRQIDRSQRRKSKRYHAFESNEPGTFYATMVQLLTRNPVGHRIPLGQDSEATRKLKAAVEDLIQGTYRDVDRQRTNRIVESTLQVSLSQFALSDGWAVAEVVTHEDESRPYVDIRTYDPIDVAFDWSDTGTNSVVLHTTRTPLQVAYEYPEVDMSSLWMYNSTARMPYSASDVVDVYTCYYKKGGKVYYGCVINNQWAITPYLTDWTEIPVSIRSFNGLPFRADGSLLSTSDTGNDDYGSSGLARWHWTQDVGRGIFFANEKLYAEFNELWSMVLDFVDKEARNTYWKQTVDGDDSAMEIGKGTDAINALAKDESIGRLPPGSLGNELMLAFQQLSGALQRGGISWQLTGQVPPGDLSGFAINQLISAALTVATPYINGLTAMYQQLDQIIMEAYRISERSSINVGVMRNNSFIEREVDLAQIRDRTFYFDVKLKAGLPDDLAERLGMAINAKKGELLDSWTILDEILQVDDPELIMDRQTEERVLNMPNIQLRRAAIALLRQGRMDEATAVLTELQMYTAGQQVQQGQAQVQLSQIQQMLGGTPNPAQTDLQGNGGAGPDGGVPPASPPAPANPQLQAQRTGLPSDILPPEMTGVSPAAARSFAEVLTQRVGRGAI